MSVKTRYFNTLAACARAVCGQISGKVESAAAPLTKRRRLNCFMTSSLVSRVPMASFFAQNWACFVGRNR
jgi:hypothetical protein